MARHPVPRFIVVVAGLVVAGLLLAGCGGDDVPTVTRTDSAGVAVVISAGSDRPLGWRFEERFRLGGDDEGPASFYALSPGRVATDGGGRIYVLDGSAHRVAVFDSAGRSLGTLGREGAGPGELEMPAGLDVAGGVVGVWDFGKSGLVRFGPSGDPLPGLTSPAFYGGRGLLLLPTGAVFTTTDMRDPSALRDALVVLDTAYQEGGEGWRHLRTVASVPIPDAPLHRFEACAIAFRLPPLFHPDVEWAPGPDGRLYVSDEAGYVVDVYADTLRVASWRRALEPPPATRALAEASLGEGMTVSVGNGPRCTIPPAEVVDARGWADRIPLVESLAVDPAGRVWLERTAIDEPTRVDILGADGAYLGTLTDPPVPVAFLPDGSLLAIETDDLDVDRLVAYRVVEEAAR